MHLGENPPRLAHLGPHRLDVGIFRGAVVMQQVQAVTPQLDQPLGIIGQTDDERVVGSISSGGSGTPGT